MNPFFTYLNNRSLKIKILLGGLLVGGLALTVSTYLRVSQIESLLKERLELRAVMIVRIIETFVRKKALIMNYERLSEYAEAITSDPEINYVAFFDKNNMLIASSGKIPEKKFNFKTDLYFEVDEQNFNVYRQISDEDGNKIGMLAAGISIARYHELVAINRKMIIIIWSISFLPMLVATYVLLSFLLKPVQILRDAMVSIGNGDFNIKIPVYSNDEIGQISAQGNHMAEKLSSLCNGLSESNKQLKDIDRRKTEFVTVVTHDLRTPLTSIMGFSETMLNKNIHLTQEQREHYLKIIFDEATRLSRFISDFLSIHNIEEGKIPLKFVKTNLRELIQELIDKTDFTKKKIDAIFETDENIPDIVIDIDQMTRAIQNIFGNAMKFAPEESDINVSLKKTDSGLHLTVSDQGVGVPDNEKQKIFQKFYRRDEDVPMKEKGVGLGLAIAKSIVEFHGGSISIEDNSPKGAKFVIFLPFEKKQ